MIPSAQTTPDSARVSAAPPTGISESRDTLLWCIMRRFEVQALGQYQAHAPELATAAKHELVTALRALSPSDVPLRNSVLGKPMDALVASAERACDRVTTLVVQGLVLECVRQVVYLAVAGSRGPSKLSRGLATGAASTSTAVTAMARLRFADAIVGTGAPAFDRFAAASDEVLHRLDAVGEGVDEVFGEAFGLRFADVVADFVADLVPVCAGLGMERRKVMSHLAAALMGL